MSTIGLLCAICAAACLFPLMLKHNIANTIRTGLSLITIDALGQALATQITQKNLSYAWNWVSGILFGTDPTYLMILAGLSALLLLISVIDFFKRK